MDSMVRAASLRGLPLLVDALGGDGAALLARFRVSAEALESDDAVIPSPAAGRILETAAAELGCPDLGLRLAGQQNATVLGPLALAIENSPTFGAALNTATRFLFVHSPTLTVSQIPDPAGRAGVVGLLYRGTEAEPLPPQVIDLGLGLFHRIIMLLHGGPYGLRSVHLPHAPLAPVASYTGFFGADVRFGRPDAVLRVPGGLVAMAVPGGNQVLRDIAVDYITSHFPAPGRAVTDRVHLLLSQALGTSPVRVGAIARLLRTHPRTLQRRLAAEHTTFETILDDVRRATAARLITQTDLPFVQVTAMIGLAEQSALSRASRRWFGLSPRALRATVGGPARRSRVSGHPVAQRAGAAS
ncbi:AraC family transcriptional regulator [Actinoplanes sp. ATCC 53533]|uniref:AraC family transcriptional regulator n=1 Tax=Actinoplanes sp. ATCC 53533 TaxID=1288362 RepID=UPI001F37BB6B|nr:AraC family transcriptional regulator [Actinoplanes sp. ATCC 53533]